MRLFIQNNKQYCDLSFSVPSKKSIKQIINNLSGNQLKNQKKTPRVTQRNYLIDYTRKIFHKTNKNKDQSKNQQKQYRNSLLSSRQSRRQTIKKINEKLNKNKNIQSILKNHQKLIQKSQISQCKTYSIRQKFVKDKNNFFQSRYSNNQILQINQLDSIELKQKRKQQWLSIAINIQRVQNPQSWKYRSNPIQNYPLNHNGSCLRIKKKKEIKRPNTSNFDHPKQQYSLQPW